LQQKIKAMKKTNKELVADGWQKTIKDKNTVYKRTGRHFIFHNKSNGILCEIDLDKDFKLHKGDKELTSYLNFVFKTYGQKNTAKKYKEENKDWEFELAYHVYNIETFSPSFLTSPNGKKCYFRRMITTDENYLRGMEVIVEVDTEKVLLKHFHNVSSIAIEKGFKHI
jgi:hypothetical protein